MHVKQQHAMYYVVHYVWIVPPSLSVVVHTVAGDTKHFHLYMYEPTEQSARLTFWQCHNTTTDRGVSCDTAGTVITSIIDHCKQSI
jgi:methylthioribose-1-phosphate isomerase